MVYGLNIVPENGYIVNVELVDGNPSAIRAIDQEPDGGVSYEGVLSGRRCHADHFPMKVRWLDRQRRPIPDFDRGEILNVSERAKEIIERFEPGVHQFVPVDYVDARDAFLERRYCWVICNRIDSIDREHTTFVLDGRVWALASDLVRWGEADKIPAHIDPNTPGRFVFSLSKMGGAHAWRDKHMNSGTVWLSRALGDAFKDAGLTGIRLPEAGMETV